jgi:hypothetical protein
MAQAVSRQPLGVKARFGARVSPYETCGGRSGTGTRFFSKFFDSPLSMSFHRDSQYSVYNLGDEQQARWRQHFTDAVSLH